ncbi:NACHT domain-containing protein [Nonomuraea sp. NPDC050790]|uniref:NACHT domain-containing protein n=1 Tax=Nonomuraea sp. NPDC050790 TaxID=3364371 RepID=UPI0037BA4388
MALEAAALAVGKAVGDRAARTWLAARSTADSRSLPLLDLMRSRFPDQLVRRKAERQLADIADSVTARVLKLAGHEYPGLEDNARETVLAEIVATLSRADLSDAALLAADTDPVRLARSLPRPKDLDEPAARLYETVLDEVLDCLVRIVRHLPEFQPRAATETLTRLSGLGEQVALILDRLPARTLEAPDGTDRDAAFARRYLEHVSRTLDTLDLIGVRVERFTPRTSLSVAYISLSVSAALPPAREIPFDAWHAGGREPATMRVESALGRSRRTLLRGEAGGGKSTLLRWLAITAARSAFESDLSDCNGTTPFLVKLRSYADRELPRPEHFLDGSAAPLAGLMPTGWVHRRLSSGRALLLVDGVDELTGSQRKAIRPWLRGLLAEFPGIRVVVTSRPAAADSRWLEDDGFVSAFLERMTPGDTTALVRHWHTAIRTGHDLPCAPEKLPAYEERLLTRLENSTHLRSLAATPLLASMLCALNLDREAQLPPDRMGLYGAALEMLLERRDAERSIPSYGAMHLDRAQKTQILQELAWQLSISNRVELAKPAAVSRVGRVVAGMPRVRMSGEAVLEYLLDRCGVIREATEGRIDFVHRTLQEYLTARAAAEDGDIEPLVTWAHRDQWRDVVVLAAGHANGPVRTELLRGLLRRVDTEPRQARRLKLVVTACLETMPSVPVELRERIEACVQDLVPPRSSKAARSLAMAGEAVLHWLPADLSGLSVAAARATVRTAWLVNGPRALEMLAGYAGDTREVVLSELLTGWRYFDPDMYAEHVLSRTALTPRLLWIHTKGQFKALDRIQPQRGIFTLSALKDDLSPLLRHRDSLTTLGALGFRQVVDLSPLRSFTSLESLALGHNCFENLAFLASLPQLTDVTLFGLAQITDYAPLRTLREAHRLALTQAAGLTRWEQLPPLDHLEHLWLEGSRLVESARDLAQRAPMLRRLDLAEVPLPADMEALGYLPLDRLSLREIVELEDLRTIARYRDLTNLCLSACPGVHDLSPLADLTRLQTLDIRGVQAGIDLAPLAGLPLTRVVVEPGQVVVNADWLGDRLAREP